MSQMSVATTVAKRSSEGSRRTSLRVVTPEERAGSAWFPAICIALLLAGLAAVLGLNTAMAQDSFEVARLEAESARLADTEDSLTQTINGRSAPQRLATRAEDLGMVPAGGAAFIDLDKSKVLGVATAAKKEDRITVDAAATATADESSGSSSSRASGGNDKDTSSSKSRSEKSSERQKSSGTSTTREKPSRDGSSRPSDRD